MDTEKDGNVQTIENGGINKQEDMASPTVATQSVFITTAIYAYEDYNLELFYIPGKYLHIETDEDEIVFLEGSLNDIMVKVTPNIYRKYTIISSR